MRHTLSAAPVRPRRRRSPFAASLLAATALLTACALLAGAPAALASVRPASAGGWTLAFPPYQNLNTVPYAPLEGITAVSSSDAWAVGQDNGHLLSDYWNGTSWSSVGFPAGNPCDTFESDCNLTSVSSSDADDVIAVGDGTIPGPNGWEGIPLAFEWTGSAWHEMTPPSNATDGEFAYVDVFSPTDAWAVGSAVAGVGEIVTSDHFNGTSWTQVPTPIAIANAGLTITAIDGSSPSDIWACGFTEIGGYGGRTFTSVLMHWSGRGWKSVAVPDQSGLLDVSDVSPTDAWAIAKDYAILHWNGTAWTKVATVPYAVQIRALSARDVWAGGIESLAHFNGTTWTTEPTPTGMDQIIGSASVAPGDVWFSGGTYPPNATETPAVISTTTG